MTNARINVLNKGSADLRHIGMAAKVCLNFVELEVTHRFANLSSDESIEIQYTFPVPAAAVLLSLTARVGERELVGACTPRVDAQDNYDEAVSDGESAVLVERTADGIYSLNLGHLGANDDAELRYRYAFPAPWQSGQLRLALPTCIAPRYGHPVGIEDWQVPETNALAEHQVSFSVLLDDALMTSTATSPTHDIRRTDNIITLTDETTFADRDFVVFVDHDVSAQPTHCAWHSDSEDDSNGVACLNVTAPHGNQIERPRRVHFLLDCSGSMQGDSIRLAKEAFVAALDRLGDVDSFAMSAFGTTCEHAPIGNILANDSGKREALKWIRSRQANLGGTEFQGAVDACLKRYRRNEAPDFLILTDGEFWEVDEVARAAKAQGSRLFVVGIGAAPAAEQIHALANATGASAEFLTPNEEFSGAMERMVSRMHFAERVEVEINWGSNPDWQVPDAVSAWPGERVTVFVRMPHPSSVSVLVGTSDPVDTPVAECTDDVVRLGWSRYIDDCVRHGETNDALTARSAALGLVNQLTSMVMLDPQHVEVGGDSPELYKVPQMLAAGWGGSGSLVREDFLEAPAFLRVASKPTEPRAMFRHRAAPSEQFFASRITEYKAGDALQRDDEPFSDLLPLVIELATQLGKYEAEDAIKQVVDQAGVLMGPGFARAIAEQEANGLDRLQLISALLEKAMVHKSIKHQFSFFDRRKLGRYLKAHPSSTTAQIACEDLLAAIAA